VNPSEPFLEYLVDVDEIFFYTWDGKSDDMEEYFFM
jgi:hypothetical protein